MSPDRLGTVVYRFVVGLTSFVASCCFPVKREAMSPQFKRDLAAAEPGQAPQLRGSDNRVVVTF
jgi:hypothetical protein